MLFEINLSADSNLVLSVQILSVSGNEELAQIFFGDVANLLFYTLRKSQSSRGHR